MRKPTQQTAIVAFGLLVALSTQARSQDSSRETIIQGVRDSVRHRKTMREPPDSPDPGAGRILKPCLIASAMAGDKDDQRRSSRSGASAA